MPPKKRKSKKTPALDLSEVKGSDTPDQFIVKSYDYDDLQTEKSQSEIQFEDDLKYLLAGASELDDSVKVVYESNEEMFAKKIRSATSKPGKNGKSKPVKVSAAEITKDFDQICFSSDDESEIPLKSPKSKRSSKKNGEKAPVVADETGHDSSSLVNETEPRREKPVKTKQEKSSRKVSEAHSGDSAPGVGSQLVEKTPKKSKKKQGNEAEAKSTGEDELNSPKAETAEDQEKQGVQKTKKKSKKSKLAKKTAKANEVEQTTPVENEDVAAEVNDLQTEDQAALATQNKAKKNRKKKTKAQKAEQAVEADGAAEVVSAEAKSTETVDAAVSAESPASSQTPDSPQTPKSIQADEITLEEKPEDSNTPDSPKSETLLKSSSPAPEQRFQQNSQPAEEFPKLRSSSATALSYTQLPEIHPVKTIIGVSHQQILLMRTTDVKYKTISTVSLMSKMGKNVLQFLSRDGLFSDPDMKRKFLHLCIEVALNESHGFHDISRQYPDLEAWLANYEELSLLHTRANLTVSTKQAHQNDFDYNVFSYLGHILVWAIHLQQSGGVTTVLDKYEFGISRKSVMASIGGYHLWDRVRRDPKTINTKRWKHIQKFRQLFVFEEDQFVLAFRLLDLGLDLP